MNALEQQVLRLIGEDPAAPDVFTDTDSGLAPIRDSINDAIAELNMLTGGYTETLTVPLVANRSFYRLRLNTSEIAWIRTLWLANQRRKLTQTSLTALVNDDPRWMKSRGTPENYVPIGFSTFALYPVPSSSSDVVEATIVVVPNRYTNSNDWIKVRRGWEYALVNYAVSEYWAGRGDARTAAEHHRRYAQMLGHRFEYPDSAETPHQASSFKQDPGNRLGPTLND